MYFWTKYRVSYVFLFEFNPRTRLSHFQIFTEVSFSLAALVLLASHIAKLRGM